MYAVTTAPVGTFASETFRFATMEEALNERSALLADGYDWVEVRDADGNLV